MLSQEQLQHLITENENLQAQVKELNLILSVREEELEYLKNNASEVAELRSRLDMQLDDFQSM
ncbi:MAG TPA: hypothetical protein VKH37_11965, partial [Ferruginibacter sp.]|nr:hypothetical protein [Ferruginibacter sp.]